MPLQGSSEKLSLTVLNTETYHVQRVRDSGPPSPQWGIVINPHFYPLPPKAQGSMWKRRQNGHKEPDVMDDSKETVFQLR